MNGRLIVVATIAGLAGFAGGVHFNAPPQNNGETALRTPLMVRPADQPPPELTRQIRSQSKLLAELAGKIDRLAASTAGEENRETSTSSERATPPVARSRATAEVTRRADELVSAALGTGVWNADNRDELRRLLPGLEAARREALMRKLIVALNSGEMYTQMAGPPF